MNVDWKAIYRRDDIKSTSRHKKFSILPGLLPWEPTGAENLWATLEWLIRDGRKDDVRFSETAVTNHVREHWYRSEIEEGRFIHICYPTEMLKYRGQYEALHQHLKETEQQDIMHLHELAAAARLKLWSAWNCIGSDGNKVEPVYPVEEFHELVPYQLWDQEWQNQCSKCCDPLPKALQMWVKLQHSKLKGAL